MGISPEPDLSPQHKTNPQLWKGAYYEGTAKDDSAKNGSFAKKLIAEEIAD
jgi:hypothetical protein